MALRLGLVNHHRLALAHIGQHRLGVVGFGAVVLALHVGREEAREQDGAPRGRHRDALCGGAARPVGLGREAHLHRLAPCVIHLTGHGATPDQFVQAKLVASQLIAHLIGRPKAVACGADGLVRLLRVLDLLLVGARLLWQVGRPVALRDFAACCLERRLRQRGRVGTHVGDETVFVQSLGHRHGLRRTEAQLAPRLLLQGGGHEGRVGTAGVGLGLHRGDRGRCVGQRCRQRRGLGLVQHQRTLTGQLAIGIEIAAGGQTHAVQFDHLGAEPCRSRRCTIPWSGCNLGLEVPIGRNLKGHAGPLAFHHDAGGHRLHPTRRQPRHHLLPQNRRHLVAVEAVEDSTGLLSIDHATIQLARVVDGRLDGIGRDLVEHHAAHRNLGAEHLQQVPRNCLTLAILIRCEEQLVRLGQQPLQMLHLGLLVAGHHVQRLEVVGGVHPQAGPGLPLVDGRNLGRGAREVADVADGGFHHIARTKKLGDGAGLGG